LADITEKTPLKISVDGRKIILEPVSPEEVERRFAAAAGKVEKRFAKMFKRLAEK
jgi:bifunctional DNA-binding transcriptional regulator/antitoxin component of YhaV-PrlF toxin-antitoxin module